MRRRALLSTTVGFAMAPLGATALGALAGCAALDRPEYEFVTEQSSHLDTVPCPNYYDTAGTTCGPPPGDGPPISLTLDARTINRNPSGDTVTATTATLENGLERAVAVPVQALQRYRDGQWYHVTEWSADETKQVPAGGTLQWSISIRQHPTPNGVVPIVHDLDLGVWAYTVVVDLKPDDPQLEDIECSAVFTVIEAGD